MRKIFNSDCLVTLKEIPSCSIDTVVTDPPYGINYQSAWRTDKAKRKPKIANDKTPFVWWIYDAARVLKDGGAFLCFCRWDVQDAFKQAIEWAGLKVKSQVIWDREWHGMGDLSSSFGPKHDVIWFATKGSFSFPNKRPLSVIRAQRISAGDLQHPNEKPVQLMEDLIKAVTPTNGVVLDPFMGSGSTGVAALNLGCEFIGIEQNKEYFFLSKQRMGALPHYEAVA